MKVCFVIPSFNFFISHRYKLIDRIASQHEVTVLTDLEEADKAKLTLLKSKSFKILHVARRKKSRVFSFLHSIYSLQKIIKKQSPDHVFFITIESSLMGALISKLSPKYKNNFVISGLWPFFSVNSYKFKIINCLAGFIFRVFTNKDSSLFIFQNSDNQKLFIQKKYASIEKTKVIYGNGIEIPKISLSKASPPKQIRFCFVGRLAKSKGLEEFIEAFKVVRKSAINANALIAGFSNKDKGDYFEASFYKKLKQERKLDFLGEVDHSIVLELYKPGDVFVLPSYGEGLPKAALEAASLSLPLILSNVSGCKECIENNGYLVEKQSVDDLASKMFKFTEDPIIVEKMGEKSRSLMMEKFSIEKISLEYLSTIS